MLAVATALLLSPVPVVAGWSSPDYRVRDRASAAAVRRFGCDNWRWADSLTCPECQTRADRGRTATVSALAKRLGPYPCADAAWYVPGSGYRQADCPFGPWIAAALLGSLEATGRDPYPFVGYRLATQRWVVERIAAGTPEDKLREILVEMRRRDAYYYWSSGQVMPY